jgi:predicted GNAT family N-acyltransferase
MDNAPDLHIKTCLFESESGAVIHRIRTAVFQLEQGIDPSLDWDGLDLKSVHLLATVGSEGVGCARLREYADASALKLERLAVLKPYRHQGIGGEMVQTAIAYSQSQGYTTLVLHAQQPTVDFYKQLGFTAVGEPFEEAAIAHLKMEKMLTPSEPTILESGD